ncbi:MAG: T9SS type A sorting domain-containing protein [Ignavibacteria bacterium]
MTNQIYTNIILALIISLLQQSVFAQKERSMWIWNNQNQSNNIINDISSYRQELFDFCKAPHGNADHRITVLFLGCRQAVYDNSENLRDFLSVASDSGLTIEYLDGDPSWATYNQESGFDRIQKVIEFNSNSLTEKEKIKGVHFDVEPYLLKQSSGYQPPYWDIDKMTVWESYVNYMDSCQALIDNANSDLYFGIAIPRWYDSQNHVGVDELKRLQEKVDYVAIMDYNEKSSVIIRDAENEINNAEELSKKVWIGVETKEVSPETVSFYEEGVAYMESQLDNVYEVYGSNPVFSGFAIHSYKYYKDLANVPVSVKKNETAISTDFVLNQNYPNPFNPSTNIRFFLPKTENVSLSIYNILGEKEVTLLNDELTLGWHEVNFTNEHLSSGVYFYELRANDFSERKKMMILK